MDNPARCSDRVVREAVWSESLHGAAGRRRHDVLVFGKRRSRYAALLHRIPAPVGEHALRSAAARPGAAPSDEGRPSRNPQATNEAKLAMPESGSENGSLILPLVRLPAALAEAGRYDKGGLVTSKGRHKIGATSKSMEAAAFPARLGFRTFWISLLATLLAAAGPLTVPRCALADDFELLLTNAQAEGTVSVLATGWHVITGDEAVPQGSRGDGPVAITGDDFVKELQSASGKVSVTRRYENFPVLAMEMDAAAMRAAKAHGGGVEVWEDPVLYPQLEESGPLVGAPRAWRKGYTGRGLAVAIIDDGADTRHPFLARRTVFEACFSDLCPNRTPQMIGRGAAFPAGTHGTHVAGIVLGGAIDADLAGVGPELRLIIINE